MAEEAKGDLILALDTSGDVCSVALTRAGQLVSEHTFAHRMHLSERLLDHVQAVLSDGDSVLGDVDIFAVGMGPGSFTGTRIGVMTMKTLAAIQSKPLYGIDSLRVVAGTYRGIATSLIVPILPCRTGVVFGAIYHYACGALVPAVHMEPVALELEALCDHLLKRVQETGIRNIILCGVAKERYEEALRNLLLRRLVSLDDVRLEVGSATAPRASEVATLAWHRFRSGEGDEGALDLVPLYIAPPPISQPKPENMPPLRQPPKNQEP